ncbi:MAG: flagellar basal body-associated FliL family protein [Solirubrobacteraceae bacterium]
MKKKKLLILVVVVLLVAGAGYKFGLSEPKEAEAKPKVEGTVYVLGKEFLVNLADGRFAKLTVALVLDPEDHSAAPAEGHGAAPKPPEGFGDMPQEAVVRDLITDELSGAKDVDLIERKGRAALKKHILESIHEKTDVHADDILFTDVTVQ